MELNSSPHQLFHSVGATSDLPVGMFNCVISGNRVTAGQWYSTLRITPLLKSSFIPHPLPSFCLPWFPSYLSGHPHPLNVSHQVDFTFYILSLGSFNQSHGCSHCSMQRFKVPTTDLLPEFYICTSTCLLGISQVCPKGTAISMCQTKLITFPPKCPSSFIRVESPYSDEVAPSVHPLVYARHLAITFISPYFSHLIQPNTTSVNSTS